MNLQFYLNGGDTVLCWGVVCLCRMEALLSVPEEDWARYNLVAFSEFCWPDHKPNAEFHDEIYNTLMYKGDAGKEFKRTHRLHLEAPREHAKTTAVSVKYVLWRIGRDPNIRVVVISRTGSLARDINREVRQNIMNNPWYHRVFPDVVAAIPWGDERFQVKRSKIMKDATFYGTGLEGSVTGIRADLLILDDPFDLNEVRTETQRGKVRKWINGVTVSILPADGEEIVIGTRWHEDDYYGGLLAKSVENGGRWVCKVYRAIENYEDDPSEWRVLWPEEWSAEALLARREDVDGELMFKSLYQNDPYGVEGALFKEDWLTYYDPSIFGHGLAKHVVFIMAVDPAISESPEADRTAITTIAVDRRNRDIYLVDVWADKIDFFKQINKIDEYARRGNLPLIPGNVRILKVGVETQAYQKALYSSLYPLGLPVVEVKQSRNKFDRILGLQPHFQNGRIKLPDPDKIRVNWMSKFMGEYTTFPRGKYADILDSLEITMRIAGETKGRSSMAFWMKRRAY